MNYTGIDKIVHGVEDLEKCKNFFDDWGLIKKSTGKNRALYSSLDGSEVLLLRHDDPSLPSAIERGSTIRQIIWGVDNTTNLAKVRKKLENHETYREVDSFPSCVDPNGLSVSFRVTHRKSVNIKGSPMNTWDKPNARVDRRSKVYEKAQPIKIGHVVFFVADLVQVEKFYVETLGFAVSDRYPGAGSFLRCSTPGGHHHIFLLQT